MSIVNAFILFDTYNVKNKMKRKEFRMRIIESLIKCYYWKLKIQKSLVYKNILEENRNVFDAEGVVESITREPRQKYIA